MAQLAALILEHTGERPITQEVRNRIAARAVLLKLGGVRPYFGSLERDPIHPSATYLAVDGIADQPLLLRIAPNATPASGLFPKAILIGRMPGPGGRELVANAIPFSHLDATPIRTFATQVNPSFRPRPAGIRSAILVESRVPEQVYPEALTQFQNILRDRNCNLAGFADEQAGTWAAIRHGWREGFVGATPAAAKEFVSCEQLTERRRVVCTLRIDAPGETADLIEKCSRFLL